jgi:hypothetical protein
MQRFMSLPLVLKLLVAALVLVALLVLLAGIPALISRTSDRVSGFVEGVEGTQPDLRETTTPYTAEATDDGGEPAVSPETEEYLSKVKETNVGAVEAFLKVDEEIRQFDSITADDVEEMEENRKEVSSNLDEIEQLEPPEEYREQYELFHLAIVDLDEAAGLAYSMASDPDSIAPSTPERYNFLLDRADSRLQQSDEILRSKSETTSSG